MYSTMYTHLEKPQLVMMGKMTCENDVYILNYLGCHFI